MLLALSSVGMYMVMTLVHYPIAVTAVVFDKFIAYNRSQVKKGKHRFHFFEEKSRYFLILR
jgi:hypothetical protein